MDWSVSLTTRFISICENVVFRSTCNLVLFIESELKTTLPCSIFNPLPRFIESRLMLKALAMLFIFTCFRVVSKWSNRVRSGPVFRGRSHHMTTFALIHPQFPGNLPTYPNSPGKAASTSCIWTRIYFVFFLLRNIKQVQVYPVEAVQYQQYADPGQHGFLK